VLSCIQFTKCLALFIEPTLNWLLVSDRNTPGEWRTVFFLHAAVLVVSAIVFIVFVSDQPAEFTKDKTEDDKEQPGVNVSRFDIVTP
jgi:hypothetical protein